MDRIYIELIQKDSLLAQSEINRALQFKYIQIIDSTQKDIESLKTSVNSLKTKNTDLFNESQKNRSKLIRTRKVGLIMVGIIILQALL
jgi:tetrahydromethanopterin S-methyltransferase subunit F